MKIYIPSKGRANSVKTLDSIPKWRVAEARVVVPQCEYSTYAKEIGKGFLLPTPAVGIANVRQWILENAEDNHVLFLDDDMSFYWRDEDLKLHRADYGKFEEMLQLLESWLDEGIAHVGVSQRAGNNRQESKFTEISRMNNVYAYNVEKTLSAGGRFDRLPVMEDFDMTLTLLRAGHKNRVSYDFAWSQGKSGAEGGCSTYRNFEMQREAAFSLAKMHPGLVKVHGKQSKTTWEGIGDSRADVVISWQKAYSPVAVKQENKNGISSFFRKP